MRICDVTSCCSEQAIILERGEVGSHSQSVILKYHHLYLIEVGTCGITRKHAMVLVL